MAMNDVVILGARVAGLAAVTELSGRGLRATVVEARERIGGRISTLHLPEVGAAIELGAEFIHGQPPELLKVLEKAGVTTLRTRG